MRGLLLSCLLLILGCSTSSPPAVPEWPEAAQVKRITASCSGAVVNEPDIAEFEVPSEFVPAVMRVLSPPEYHKHPRADFLKDVGQITIECNNGKVLNVRLFYFGKEPVLFTLEGVPCIRGGPYKDTAPGFHHYLCEVLTFEGFLRAIRNGNRKEAREYLHLLDKSAGREMRFP
jgi:hypothetical protein